MERRSDHDDSVAIHRYTPPLTMAPHERAAEQREGPFAAVRRQLATICRLRTFGWLVLGIAVLASLPFVKEELQLQFQCHLNASHLAKENVRLQAEVEKIRDQKANMEEKAQLYQDEADSEHSRANRSYWSGVRHTVFTILIVEVMIAIFIWYLCIKCLAAARGRGYGPPARVSNALQ